MHFMRVPSIALADTGVAFASLSDSCMLAANVVGLELKLMMVHIK